MQRQKDNVCTNIPGMSCSSSKVSKNKLAKYPCSMIRKRIKAMDNCAKLRQHIQDECFGGKPDKEHKQAIDEMINGKDSCLDLEKTNCAPEHPMANL